MTDGGRAMGDEELVERLRAAARTVDAVPPEVLAAARASFTWRTIDAELAELSFDSYDDELVGVRGSGPTRSLTFEFGDTVVELEVDDGVGGKRRVTGQVSPLPISSIELHQVGREAPLTLTADQYGRFRADGVQPGPFRLLCRFAAGAPMVLTDWVNA
jgi:hypothetical protein